MWRSELACGSLVLVLWSAPASSAGLITFPSPTVPAVPAVLSPCPLRAPSNLPNSLSFLAFVYAVPSLETPLFLLLTDSLILRFLFFSLW